MYNELQVDRHDLRNIQQVTRHHGTKPNDGQIGLLSWGVLKYCIQYFNSQRLIIAAIVTVTKNNTRSSRCGDRSLNSNAINPKCIMAPTKSYPCWMRWHQSSNEQTTNHAPVPSSKEKAWHLPLTPIDRSIEHELHEKLFF